MGTGYTRQSAASIINGNVIQAADHNAEYNAIENAFNATTGHSHDGTLGEGPLISLTTSISGILPLANGGTGSNLVDPGADRILFWDDSAGAVTWLTAGSSLNITTTTINLADGDKGDITVSSSGTVWEIDAGAVGDTEIASGINATKIGAGSVDNTEFGYLNGVTSGIQAQIDLKSPLASPTFTGTVTVPASNFTVGASLPFSDNAGTLTLQNIDAIDATTVTTLGAALESELETNIDTLVNLTSIQGRTITLADAGADAIFGWDDSAGAYQNLSASDIRTALSLVVGTNVQAWDSDLDSIAALATTTAGRSVLTITDPNEDRMMAWDDSVGSIVPIALADITVEPTPAFGDYAIIYRGEGDMRRVDVTSLGSGGGTSYTQSDFRYTATAGQTTFSGADLDTATLAYAVNQVHVYVNGRYISPVDYTATNGTSIVFDTGLTVGDEVYIIAWNGTAGLTEWIKASSAGPASLDFSEDTDNGSNKIRVTAPSSLAADYTATLPSVTGTILSTGAQTFAAADQATIRTNISAPLKGHIYGLTLSTNVTDAANDIDIAVGEAASTETNPVLMVLSSILTKRIDAAWAVGTNQGGRDTGTTVDGTWHIWLIRRSDTGVVDALFSQSASSPTMPTNYDQKRRIGSIIRTGGATRPFSQFGDSFRWLTPITDRSSTAAFATAVLGISVPGGIVVKPVLVLSAHVNVSSILVNYVSTPTVSVFGESQYVYYSSADGTDAVQIHSDYVLTNTSNQIYFSASIPAGTLSRNELKTLGYTDFRGKDGGL